MAPGVPLKGFTKIYRDIRVYRGYLGIYDHGTALPALTPHTPRLWRGWSTCLLGHARAFLWCGGGLSVVEKHDVTNLHIESKERNPTVKQMDLLPTPEIHARLEYSAGFAINLEFDSLVGPNRSKGGGT